MKNVVLKREMETREVGNKVLLRVLQQLLLTSLGFLEHGMEK